MENNYCGIEDVSAFFSSLEIEENTPINTAKTESLISAWTAYINASLRHKYVLPITDNNDLALLKAICARLAAGDIDEMQNLRGTDGTAKKRDLKSEGLKMLEEFVKKEKHLAGDIGSVTIIERPSKKRFENGET